jgi:hypothetical protein
MPSAKPLDRFTPVDRDAVRKMRALVKEDKDLLHTTPVKEFVLRIASRYTDKAINEVYQENLT